jgi:type VII secretion protein EccB
MQNRRDQVQAHAFVSARLVSAMLNTEPDEPFSPQRRFVIGTIVGVLVAALVVAGFGISGVVSPGGSKSWRKPGVLIVEKETAARYVYIDGQLRPVLNYSSARLIVKGKLEVVRVSSNSLRSVPRGLPVGIPSAPDALPDLSRKDGGDWQVCSSLRPDVNGALRAWVTLWVGGERPGRALAEPESLVVVSPVGQRYLLWNNHRLLLPSAAAVSALGYAAVRQIPVGWAFLNSVPAGPDLAAPDVPNRGAPGPRIDGRETLVGQVFKVEDALADSADSGFYVVRPDGLSPLTTTGAALMLAEPGTGKSYPGRQVAVLPLGSVALAGAPRSPDASINQQHPAKPPRAAEPRNGEVPCIRLTMNAVAGVTAQLGLRVLPASLDNLSQGRIAGDRLLADRIVVEPGAGLLIRDQPAPGVADGALFLLVDTGMRFPLAGDEVVKSLGFEGVRPVAVPAPLLAMLPVGPALDPVAALATVVVLPGPAGGAGAGPPGQGG